MKIVQRGKKRKAISPVLATVILIAITLIAAIAVAGFVFGLFGSFTSSAQVTASTVSCSVATGNCMVLLRNTGTSNTTPGGTCQETYAGVTHTGSTNGTTTPIVAGGPAIKVLCTVGVAGPSTGAQVVGQVALGNGGQAQFSGSFQ